MSEDAVQLTDEQHARRNAFIAEIKPLAEKFVLDARELGLSEAEANVALSSTYIYLGAYTACRTRKFLLGGEPSYRRWCRTTKEIFKFAAEKVCNQKTYAMWVVVPQQSSD